MLDINIRYKTFVTNNQYRRNFYYGMINYYRGRETKQIAKNAFNLIFIKPKLVRKFLLRSYDHPIKSRSIRVSLTFNFGNILSKRIHLSPNTNRETRLFLVSPFGPLGGPRAVTGCVKTRIGRGKQGKVRGK